MEYLYQELDTAEKLGLLIHSQTLLHNIEKNLNHNIQLRDYQKKALCRLDSFLKLPITSNKLQPPYHFLYNMATGSGKTIIMAGLILYLYESGYRNFLFFVNSSNILKKTKDNFINPLATKYLFRDVITLLKEEVQIREVHTFESNSIDINIKFTTVQQLYMDLNNPKENSITYQDLENKKIALIADEAHHLNVDTKKNKNKASPKQGSWESTVLNILKQNIDNILLEFTATLDYTKKDILDKYKNKILYRYDLIQFRQDRYSKEIHLIRSEYDEKYRILQALILNLYRQELATEYHIHLKPVILFKAQNEIKESEKNKIYFHNLINNLSSKDIESIRYLSKLAILQKAFLFFDKKYKPEISSLEIVSRIKSNFKFENCLSTNNEKEIETNQFLLNTLEDASNHIRAIFSVHKLNEGWDVLNLFDIVRLYETDNYSKNKLRKTTLSEVQLLGRGARYFPFQVHSSQNKYQRKYDDDLSNELRVLEEVYYHTKEDSQYIQEIKKALVEVGIYEDENNIIIKDLSLKEEFKKTIFYQTGKIYYNTRISNNYNKVHSLMDIGLVQKNYEYKLLSHATELISLTNNEILESNNFDTSIVSKKVSILDIPQHIIRYALSEIHFFRYSLLLNYFPHIHSLSHFIEDTNYLGGLIITFIGTYSLLDTISNKDYLLALRRVLRDVEKEIEKNSIQFIGSDEYQSKYIQQVFKDKKVKILKGSEFEDGQVDIIKNYPWYAYNANYGTIEEKELIQIFSIRIKYLESKFENIYLIQNQHDIRIFDKYGRGFDPSFILFCQHKNEFNSLTYQIFIESKNKKLEEIEEWKAQFLQQLRKEQKITPIHSDKYLITAIPIFYNNENKEYFNKEFKDLIESIHLK